jgi:antitoxin component of RelBE/YafQ-DinJ toxin-antitoxin module
LQRDPVIAGYVASEKAPPFEINMPKAETRAAICELEPRADRSFDSVAELLVDLNPEE